MKLVLFAYTEFGYQCTKHLHDQGEHEILIITAPADNGEPINGWESVVSYCKNNKSNTFCDFFATCFSEKIQ